MTNFTSTSVVICCQKRTDWPKFKKKAKVNAAFATVMFGYPRYFTSSLISRSLNSVFICSGASYQSWVGHGQGPQRLPAPSHCAVLHQRQLLHEEKFNVVDSFLSSSVHISSHCPQKTMIPCTQRLSVCASNILAAATLSLLS